MQMNSLPYQFGTKPENENTASDYLEKDESASLGSFLPEAVHNTEFQVQQHQLGHPTLSPSNVSRQVNYLILPMKNNFQKVPNFDIAKNLSPSSMYINTASVPVSGEATTTTTVSNCELASIQCSQVKRDLRQRFLEATFFPPPLTEFSQSSTQISSLSVINSFGNLALTLDNINSPSSSNHLTALSMSSNMSDNATSSPFSSAIFSFINEDKLISNNNTNNNNNYNQKDKFALTAVPNCMCQGETKFLLRFDFNLGKYVFYKQQVDEQFLDLVESSPDSWMDSLFHIQETYNSTHDIKVFFERMLSVYLPQIIQSEQSKIITQFINDQDNQFKKTSIQIESLTRLSNNLYFSQSIHGISSISNEHEMNIETEGRLPEFIILEQSYYSERIEKVQSSLCRTRSDPDISLKQISTKKLIQKQAINSLRSDYLKSSNEFLQKFYPKEQKWRRRGKNVKAKSSPLLISAEESGTFK